MRLSDFTTLTFDCYGTLIDWERGILHALAPIAARAPQPPSRDAILEAHAHHESAQQAQTPTMRYRDLLAIVCKRLAEQWSAPVTHEECVAYGQSVGDWPPFPDTVQALQYLQRHYRLAILSNVDNESFARTNRQLGITFHHVVTAEDAGSYKPSPRNFAYLLERLPVPKQQILHTAESLFHDHVPANHLGLATCWIHRRHHATGYGATRDPGAMPHLDFRFTTLAELAAAHRHDLGPNPAPA